MNDKDYNFDNFSDKNPRPKNLSKSDSFYEQDNEVYDDFPEFDISEDEEQNMHRNGDYGDDFNSQTGDDNGEDEEYYRQDSHRPKKSANKRNKKKNRRNKQGISNT